MEKILQIALRYIKIKQSSFLPLLKVLILLTENLW